MIITQCPRLVAASIAALLCCVASCSTTGVQTNGGSGTPRLDAATGTDTSATGPQEQDPLRAQQQQALLKKYLEDARQARIQGNLEAAYRLALQARELAPGNREVQELLVSLRREMGMEAETPVEFGKAMAELRQIAHDRARYEVRRLLQAGQEAADEGNYSTAIQNFNRALLTIEVKPEVAWDNLEDRARTLLAETEARQQQHDISRATAVERETQERLRAAEEREAARVTARVDYLLQKATLAYRRQKFATAQDLAQLALEVQPTNATAKDLFTAAGKSLRDNRTERYFKDKAVEYLKLQERLQDLKITQTDVLMVDDAAWTRALARPGRALPPSAESPEDRALRAKVETEKIGKHAFTSENGAYADVINLLSTVTDIPIIITPEGKTVINEESLVLEMNLAAPISLANMLTLMVKRSEQLAWTIKGGVVQVTTKAKAGGDNKLNLFDIRNLVFPITEFLPPSIRDLPTEAEAATPRTGGESDEKVSYIEPDALIQNIKESTDPAYWDTEGVQLEYVDGGYLLVNANPEMLRRVAAFLDDMDRFSTAVVTVETTFLTIVDNFLQEVGVDFRGLGGSGNKGTVASLDDVTNGPDDFASRGLDNSGTQDPAAHPISGFFYDDGNDGDLRARTENFFLDPLGKVLSVDGGLTAMITFLDDSEVNAIFRAVEKSEKAQIVNAQTVTVLNNNHANVAVINQTSYVRDFDVEVAQAAFIADPKVDVIHDGVVLDVRPVISHDRRHVLLVLQPTVAELQRPIPTFTTSLAGSTLPVTLQLPQLTVRSFATTANIPDGGSVLIGGMRTLTNRERRAAVPVLADIPILSYFFKNEGVSDENSSLGVMVRARITDVVEEMEARSKDREPTIR